MISINSRGDFCHGVGGGYFNINNVQICLGGSGGWVTDDIAALANGADDWKVALYNVPTRAISRGHPEFPNGVVTTNIKAGGGVYASWPGNGGVLASTGFSYPDSGLLGVGPDGALAYKPSYQSNGPTMVRELDGSEWQLTPNHAYDLQLLGQHRALFNDSALGFTVVGIPMPQRLPGNNWFPQAFLLEGQWWFGCQNEGAGVIAHPFDNPHRGYVVVPPGQDAWPAFRAIDRYTLVCVWANSEAEQAGQCFPRRFDVRTDALVDIIQIDPPDPPDPPDPEPEPEPPQVPKVIVESWDVLMKAGVPWRLDTTIKTNVETNVVVTKDAVDHLTIRAVNVAGSDTTGMVRQLTVEGPDVAPPDPPIPIPDPPQLGRFWLQPNIGSKDLLRIFDDVGVLTRAGVDAFVLYIQEILTDETTDQLGPNTYPNLVAADVFRKLAQAGIPLVLEAGSVKPGDCDAAGNTAGMQTAVQRVRDAGGVVAAIAMDEPLTANQVPLDDGGCQRPLDEIADAVSAYMRAAWALGVSVGWLEAWPEVSYTDIKTFFNLLDARGTLPLFLRADTDWNRAENEHKDPAAFLERCQGLSDAYGVTFGCFVNATVDPIATDREHHENLVKLAYRIQGILPDVAQACVAAWCRRTSTDLQDIPDNLPTYGLLHTFAATRTAFGAEIPIPEDSLMLTALVDPAKEVLAVKEVKDVGDGFSTLVLADFTENGQVLSNKVFSQQPSGAIGDGQQWWREEGADGQYEKCVVDANAAAFKPTDTYITRFFKRVGGL